MKRFLAMCISISLVLSLAGCGAKEESVYIDDNYRTYYEVFVRSFYDGNGDGVGDIEGLTQKLDYISDLGFTGIWLMPIMPSTTYHKYDVTDYYSIDGEYGDLEDFQVLLEEAHKRNINVIIDMVFNHTSSQHPWFLEATEYLKTLEEGEEIDVNECPYAGYYNFAKEAKGGYSKVEGTADWYYECVFWTGMPDLNLENEAVRREIEQIADFWLGMGVDGFRLDAVKEFVSGANQKNVEILSWYVDYIDANYPDAYLVAEVWDSLDVVTEYYASGIDSVFNYPFGNHDGKLVATLKKAGDGEAGASFAKSYVNVMNGFKERNPEMIDAPFLSNHDTGRIAGFLAPSEEKIKMAGALNLFMSGSTFVYYGEEIGMKGSGKDENKRAPMRWSADETAEGMTNPPPNMESVKQKYDTLDVQMEDVDSIYNYYKKAIAIRNKYPEIARGEQTYEALPDGDIIVMGKVYEEKTTYVVCNNSEVTKTIDIQGTALEGAKLADSLVVTPSEAEAVSLDGTTLVLPPFGVCVLK